MINKRLLTTLIVVLILLVVSYLAMIFLAGKKKDVLPPKVDKSVITVKTKPVQYSSAMVDVVQTGRVISKGRVDLIAEVSGKMLPGDVPLFVGQSFRKGDVLLRIYETDALLALKASKSRFMSSIANVLPDLKYDYPENYNAWLEFFNNIKMANPLPDLPEVKNENEKIYLAGKGIFNDYYTIQKSEIVQSRYEIKAPFNGSYTVVNQEVGSIANVGSRIATMIRTDILELQVPISIEEIAYVKAGNTVEVEYSGKTTSGKVNRVSDFVDMASQSIQVYVELQNSSAFPLYEGMYMKAKFAQTELKDVMEIPREAIFNFNEVFLVKDGKLSKSKVNLARIGEYSAYISGLETGSLVVIESLINATDQMPVQIAQ